MKRVTTASLLKQMTKTLKPILFSLLLWTMLYGLTYAAVPHLINYQGRLTDSSGTPLNGSYSLTFRIYDAESAGNLLWEETQSSVVIQKGIFSVLLGSVTNLGLAFDKPYFLEIKVGNEVMSPRQRITSAGYAIRAEKADISSALTGVLPVTSGGTGTSVPANTANGVVVLDAAGYLPDNSVDRGALKTSTCLIGHTTPQGWGDYTVTGGEYCFYPQIKVWSSSSQNWGCNIYTNQISHQGPSNYTTVVSLCSGSTGVRIDAQFRYISSSGIDYWLWILVNKDTKEVISMAGAPDHPAYGNGGDFIKIPHPFASFDSNTQEIVLIDKSTAKSIQNEAKGKGLSVLELVDSTYKIDFSKELEYTPMHSGKYIDSKGRQIKEMVDSVPDYIKVKRLAKLTLKERQDKEIANQAKAQKIEQEKQKKAKDRQRAIDKLRTLGLTRAETEALIEVNR